MRMEIERLAIKPGVAAVLLDEEGRVLLHRRHASDGWAPPSGTLEPGEDIHSGLLRELWEETCLDVAIEHFVGLYSDPQYQIVHYLDGRAVHFITSLFVCRCTGGRLQGSDEGTAWAWFERDRLPADLLPYATVWLEDALSGQDGVVR